MGGRYTSYCITIFISKEHNQLELVILCFIARMEGCLTNLPLPILFPHLYT